MKLDLTPAQRDAVAHAVSYYLEAEEVREIHPEGSRTRLVLERALARLTGGEG